MKKTILTIILGILLVASLVNVSALTIDSVTTTPNEVKPGQTAEIKIVIENEADIAIEDVSVKLNLDNLPLAPFDSTNEKTVDEIDDDDKETYRFNVIALNDAESGIYKIPIEISYTEDDENKTRSGLISMIINDIPELSVLLEEEVILKGQQKEVSVRIINKGLSNVEFLEVELLPGTSYSILSSNKVYIGEVESDDFDSAEYTLLFKPTASNIINLPVTIRYKDITNKEFLETKNLELRIYSQKDAIKMGLIKPNLTGVYIGIAIVVIILWFVWRKIRKARKAKKAREQAAS